MKEDIIIAENLSKTYWLGKFPIYALKNVSLKVKQGERIAIFGPSGSGKTTLLNLIGALDKPTSGRIYLDGYNLVKASEKELCKIRRETVGFVFQHFYLVPTLTALENIILPSIPLGKPKLFKERAKELLEEVGLIHRLNHKPNQLSGGEQQRVAICRALINNPKVLLCDEITAEIDRETSERILSLLKRLNEERNLTLVFATHDERVSSKMERTIKLIDGRILT